ncbi:UNVERIFIED_CONTAM: Glucan endo-1,3-beta-glucosidase [Sesamum radiatum]|uniref:Glucan endo-1,3-beta-glucosidase n=1 Tax=Sesamum radiatum TaxID=300843 RepID=A0AAW2UMB5_SESRA
MVESGDVSGLKFGRCAKPRVRGYPKSPFLFLGFLGYLGCRGLPRVGWDILGLLDCYGHGISWTFSCVCCDVPALQPRFAHTGAGSIGVCNGRLGSDLPPEQEVVELYKTSGIRRMRIYDSNQATLTTLQGSDIELVLDVRNVDLESLQSDATHWVQTNVVQYFSATRIRYIAVGNEVDPEKGTSRFVLLVLPDMQNIHKALSELGLQDQIKVSTATYSALLMNTYALKRYVQGYGLHGDKFLGTNQSSTSCQHIPLLWLYLQSMY